MKKLLLFALIAFSTVGCSLESFYQVYHVESPDVAFDQKDFVFKNNDVRISYDFWAENGQMAFKIFNLSNKPIYIDLDRSHFILNEQSYDYFTNSESMALVSNSFVNKSIAFLASSTKTTTSTAKQKQVIELPPKSSISISDYIILNVRYMDCNLKKSDLEQPEVVKFNSSNTPANFRNYITYDFSPKFEKPQVVDNSFMITNVVFLNSRTFIGKQVHYKECPDDDPQYDEKSSYYTYPYKSADNFFMFVQRGS